MPARTQGEPGRNQASRPDPPDVARLDPRTGRPGQGRRGQGEAGLGGVDAAPADQDERHVGIHAEEGEREQAPNQARPRAGPVEPRASRAGSAPDRPARRSPGRPRTGPGRAPGWRRSARSRSPQRRRPAGAPSAGDGWSGWPASVPLGRPSAIGPGSRSGTARVIAGIVRTAARTTNGSRPRKTSRQLAFSATKPLIAGPMIPGTTQAVDSTANIRGRRVSGMPRAIAT